MMVQEDHEDFWTNVRDFYRCGLFCDLELCAAGEKSSNGIKCHQLVLASISRVLNTSLRWHFRISHEGPGFCTIIVLPDVSGNDLKQLVDNVYDRLAGQEADYLKTDSGLSNYLGLCLPEAQKTSITHVDLIKKVDIQIKHVIAKDMQIFFLAQ